MTPNAAIDRAGSIYELIQVDDEIQPISAPVESLVRFRPTWPLLVSSSFKLDSTFQCKERRMAIQLIEESTFN